jgi:hypothetical protein
VDMGYSRRDLPDSHRDSHLDSHRVHGLD